MKRPIKGEIAKDDLNYRCLAALKARSYSEDEVNNLCRELDEKKMFYRVTFKGSEKPEVTLSKKTWDIQQGHYPTIFEMIDLISNQYDFTGVEGSLIIWLGDGIWKKEVPYSMRAPILTFGREKFDNYSFLIPDPAYLGSDGYFGDRDKINEWEEQIKGDKKETILWRGAATGIGIEGAAWINTARGTLVMKAKEINNDKILDAKFTKYAHLEDSQVKEFGDEGVIDDFWDFRDFLDYKYLVDADGYAAAWMSFFLKMLSKSIVLKIQSDYDQWYYNKIVPWKHYIPLMRDLAEIEDIYEWLVNNPKKVEQIVSNANELLKEITIDKEYDNIALLFKEIIACQNK